MTSNAQKFSDAAKRHIQAVYTDPKMRESKRLGHLLAAQIDLEIALSITDQTQKSNLNPITRGK